LKKISGVSNAIRTHANFSEYIPLCLILLAGLEMQGVKQKWLHIIAGTLVLARLAHAVGMNSKAMGGLRPVGATSNYFWLIGASIANIWFAYDKVF